MPVVSVNLSDLREMLRNVDTPLIIRYLDSLGMEAEVRGEELRVEVAHNRPDLLSVEGLARLLKGVLGIRTGIDRYRLRASKVELKVEKSVVGVRPYIAAGVVRNVKLTEEVLVSIMQMQEKLHETYCRKRRKASIGFYDLDKIEPPVYYRAVRPTDVSFVPLGFNEEMDLLRILREHPKGIEFAHLLEGFNRFPILQDSKGTVLSMPPIVNSENTKVTTDTKNLFIDVTGTDKKTVENTLKILMCAMAERGFTLESVKGSQIDLSPRSVNFNLRRACEYIGISVKPKDARRILARMRLELKGNRVLVPPYRVDIMHEVDLIEELAIGYGYDRLEVSQPKVATVGEIHPLEKLARKIRQVMIGLGFTEVVNYILTSPKLNFELMETTGDAVQLLNPVSEEYSILRTWILPSLMMTCSKNKIYELPQRFFEIGDVVFPEVIGESVKTERHVAATIVGGNFTEIKATVEALVRELGIKIEIKAGSHSSFIEGRTAELYRNGEKIGILGEIHPKVLENFQLLHPVAAFELEVCKVVC